MNARAVLLLACGLAAPLAGAAQTLTAGTAQLDDDTGEVNYVGVSECNGTAGMETLRWNLSSTPTVGGKYEIWVSDHSWNTSGTDLGYCQAASQDVKTVFVTEVDTSSASVDLQPGDLVTPLAYTCDPTTDRKIYLCVEFRNAAGARAGYANATLTLQTRPPPAPVSVKVGALENALDVSWSNGTLGSGQAEAFEYVAYAQAGDETSAHASGRTESKSVRIEGLRNEVAYQVTVVAYSKGNNPSDPSAAVTGTPVPVDDFWEHYKNAGGTDSGGCSSGPAGLGALAGLALARLIRRRRS